MKHFLKSNNTIIAALYIIIIVGTLSACANKLPLYKSLDTQNIVELTKAKDFTPHFTSAKYICNIAGKYGPKKYSLSGILLLKTMEDNSTRAVFQNEMGLNYFDFQWDANNQFSVLTILDKMNQPPLIKSLQKDFEIILFKNEIDKTAVTHYTKNETEQFVFAIQKGQVVYEIENDKIKNISVVDNNKVYTSFIPTISYALHSLPDQLLIMHHKANYSIQLKSFTDEPIIEE